MTPPRRLSHYRLDERVRLLWEADANARLQHPAIATFFESGSDHGVDFIAMELVEGITLRVMLERGALAPARAVPLAMAILEGLSHAHAAGVLHRDIKPENIIVGHDGVPKLFDFGLAAFAQEDSDVTLARLTGAGIILGTPGYFAPEQVVGDAPDARTDVFGVGAVLYEMLSGWPAFVGAAPAERLAAVLARTPAPLADRGTPRTLADVVMRALARHREARFPSAGAFLRALRELDIDGAVSALPDTIAVLDFDNLSRQPGDDWLGNGIAESMAADLSKVASRPSAQTCCCSHCAPRGTASTRSARPDAASGRSTSVPRATASTWRAASRCHSWDRSSRNGGMAGRSASCSNSCRSTLSR